MNFVSFRRICALEFSPERDGEWICEDLREEMEKEEDDDERCETQMWIALAAMASILELRRRQMQNEITKTFHKIKIFHVGQF